MYYVNSQKGIAPIILILILGLTVAGIGGMQYFSKHETKQVSKSSVTDSTVNWKTYTNTQYGFEVKYPQHWLTQENVLTGDISFEEREEVIGSERPIDMVK